MNNIIASWDHTARSLWFLLLYFKSLSNRVVKQITSTLTIHIHQGLGSRGQPAPRSRQYWKLTKDFRNSRKLMPFFFKRQAPTGNRWDRPKNPASSLVKEMDYLAWRRFVWWNRIPMHQLGGAALHTKDAGIPVIKHECVSGRSYQRESLTESSRVGPVRRSHLVEHEPSLPLDVSLLPVHLSRNW